MKTKLIVPAFFVLGMGITYAQDTIQNQLQALKDEINTIKDLANTHSMIRGYGHFGVDASKENVTFTSGSFNPIFLWRQGDKFIFESELEMQFEENRLDFNLEYANASYIISNGLVVRIGKFLVPFGTFGEKLHAAWINKLSTTPLGIGHAGIVPISDVGIEIRGGLQSGKSKLNYSLYAINGPRIKDGTDGPEEAGMLLFDNTTDNNKNKAIGSRIGLLPLSNSSLEIGFSGYYAMPGSKDSPFKGDPLNEDIKYKNVTVLLTAGDLSYVKLISPLKGIIDIKGQFNLTNVSKATYFNPEDTSRYTFTNNSSSYYAQLAYRPTIADNDVLRNLEIVARYSAYKAPRGSLWYSNQSQIAVGLNYWLTWRSVIKVSYQETTTQKGNQGMTGMAAGKMFFIHLAVGL